MSMRFGLEVNGKSNWYGYKARPWYKSKFAHFSYFCKKRLLEDYDPEFGVDPDPKNGLDPDPENVVDQDPANVVDNDPANVVDPDPATGLDSDPANGVDPDLQKTVIIFLHLFICFSYTF